MSPRARNYAMGGTALAIVAAVLWATIDYRSRRGAIDKDIQLYRSAVATRDSALNGRARLRHELTEFSRGTLGTNEEAVSAALRTSLNEMLRRYGLDDISVSTVHPNEVPSPVARTRTREYQDRAAKDRPDFLSLTARLQGTGTLEGSLRVLATLEAQPWAHRVDSFSLEATGKERDRIRLLISVTTLYLPDVALARSENEPLWSPIEDADFARCDRVLSKNVFAPPRPAVGPSGPETAVASAPPEAVVPSLGAVGAQYGEWRVTGIARGRDGPEIWLSNERTRESRTLLVGGTLLESTVLSTDERSSVQIQIGDQVFEVSLGQTLADRRLVAK